MAISLKLKKSDTLGAFASGLCLIHCLATPFIFAAHAGAAHHGEHGHGHDSPFWWGMVDSLLLIVSFWAVLWSSRRTSRKWVSVALFVSWGMLLTVILNEKVGMFHLPEEAIYVPTILLVGFHLYNRRYCQCEDDQCCADPNLNSAAP